jgi:hypothetical protein
MNPVTINFIKTFFEKKYCNSEAIGKASTG